LPESAAKTALESGAEVTPLTQGDFCDLSLISYMQPASKVEHPTAWDRLMADETEVEAVLKVVQRASDNDLLANEVRILNHLFPPEAEQEKFLRYLPHLMDSFFDGARHAIVLARIEGYVSLADILKSYPEGIDYRDFAWMFRRMLEGIGYVHQRGVVHAALVPSHILVHPTDHGAKLIDWSYAVQAKETVKAVVGQWRPYYAPEILHKIPPRPSSDLYMLAKCAVALLGGNPADNSFPDKVPDSVQAFFRGCLMRNPAQRPSDAWKLYDEFAEVLHKLVGRPRYRPFEMPALN